LVSDHGAGMRVADVRRQQQARMVLACLGSVPES
jgi:hypothetical protein